MKIYGFAPSTYTQTAISVAKEVGAKAELVPLEFKKPSHFAKHPYGKMPALEDGDVTLFETLAIATYVDAKGALQPKNKVERARMMQWVSAAIDYSYEDLVNKLHADDPEAEAVTAASEQLKLLDAALAEHTYFAGDTVSLADFFLFPMVTFAKDKLGDGCLKKLPALARWYDEMAKRPSSS